MVEIALSKSKWILNLLFLSPKSIRSFTKFPTESVLVLVEQEGDFGQFEKQTSLPKTSLGLEITESSYWEQLAEKIGQLSTSMGDTKQFISQLILRRKDIVNQLETAKMPFAPIFKDKLFEGFCAILMDSLFEEWKRQPSEFRNREFVKELMTFEIIRPVLQVSLCPHCGNFEFIYGTYSLRESECPRCRREMMCTRIYEFLEPFGKIKERGDDLAYFIREYVEKMSSGCLVPEVSKRFPPDIEIDVFIEKNATGVECKTYLSKSLSQEVVGSRAGELALQLKSYKKAGVKRALVITNLTEEESSKLESQVRSKLADGNISFEGLTFIHGSIDSLLSALDEEIGSSR